MDLSKTISILVERNTVTCKNKLNITVDKYLEINFCSYFPRKNRRNPVT